MNKILLNKIKTIELLVAELNICSEKELAELTMEKLLDINTITITQLREIQKLKKAVKDNKLFSYLSESLHNSNCNPNDSLKDDILK